MAAQYVSDESGTYIPATQRTDGSWRKPRRVKEGYVPQDEVPLYESKGKQFAKNKPILPPGLHLEEVVKVQQGQSGSIPGLTEMLPPTTTKSTKKKKKKKHQQQCNTSDQNLAKDVTNLHISETGWDKNNETSENKASGDPVKRIKNLKKKLRDIEKLEQKIESGELLKPEKDQLEKISRKGEIEAEIEDLELDLELQDD
ncbi:partner of Y14 and mago-like isoform X1 [Limulus polyphemus]|uniref:Partner of Y14 and mago n=1 Tax=Limulus polyphemus TaxID=6850 RepID=A0ABM1BUW4_LIMPO|nr:partner of Y14 and mago-like isoform X1 [Limulus polyphemus]XP_022257231.1 partner of Y14 and mago-like isoform X1 [Limulus polyphemus]